MILNPGLEKVRNFIVDTIKEFLEKYDVEGIHFDDYFYCNMSAGRHTKGEFSLLNKSNRITYEEYIDNHKDYDYDKNNGKDKAQ